MRKKIKKSIRGVTFSAESKRFPVGSHYRYRVDVKNRKLIIVSSETGNTVSRKKSGAVIKPLFDIRSKEVKEQLAACDFMEIEVQENEIHVFFCKKLLSFLERKMHRTEEVLRASITGCVSIPVNMLPAASGGECYSQITIADYLSRITLKATKDDERGIRKDLDAVFKVISLFSGAGLLDYPFARDPVFDICYAVDCDASACESYRRNIGPHIHCKKTSDISLAELPDANVIIGGPSCKAVSNENRRTRMANHQDYNLIDDYIRVAAETRPDIFAIENVPEFLTAGQGEQIEKVVSSLGEYCISSVVVMDGDLGGYSLRKRAIIVGSRIGEIKFPDIKVVTRHTEREALNKVNATWFKEKLRKSTYL